MRNVLFVNPPNHCRDLADLAPPLGLLVLSDVAERLGFECSILDLALPKYFLGLSNVEAFYASALNEILSKDPFLVAFTSMGVNTHVALELARRIKKEHRDILTVAGGPHFASIEKEVAQHFSFIDVIVVGEGETGFQRLLDELASGSRRVRLSERIVAPQKAFIPNHPHSAYDHINLQEYFDNNHRRLVDYEGGRGCIFKCSFCYSPSHFDSVRDLPPAQIVSDWTALAARGVQHAFMVQDNFTNSPSNAIAICEALAEADLPITWNGYATLPQLTAPVAKALGRSKCRQIYLGVDAVTTNQSIAFNKRFYHGHEQLLSRLRMLRDEGVEPTCAFMLDLFRFDPAEVEVVLEVAAFCASAGAAIRLNTFTRYPGSGLQDSTRNSRYSDSKIRVMMDCPDVVRENTLACDFPSIFPFHSTEEKDEVLWYSRLRTVWLAQRLIQLYPDDFCEMAREDGTLLAGLTKMIADAGVLKEIEIAGKKPSQRRIGELY